MRLHKRSLAKVTSLQPVRWRRTLKLTDCHTSNEARSKEVSGVLYWWMGRFLPPRGFLKISMEPTQTIACSGIWRADAVVRQPRARWPPLLSSSSSSLSSVLSGSHLHHCKPWINLFIFSLKIKLDYNFLSSLTFEHRFSKFGDHLGSLPEQFLWDAIEVFKYSVQFRLRSTLKLHYI